MGYNKKNSLNKGNTMNLDNSSIQVKFTPNEVNYINGLVDNHLSAIDFLGKKIQSAGPIQKEKRIAKSVAKKLGLEE
ncbi:MAG: hypothetical protein HY918_01575 [Candidatus Doudnabacteria bacterium]|nr:hypothetical protein [Candidatus Doudnabacteria bacterium]